MYLPGVAPHPMVPSSRGVAWVAVTILVGTLLVVPSGGTVPRAGVRGTPGTAEAAPAGLEYVNLTDTAANWTTDFAGVVWPTGPFASVQLELTLTNYGDPWDRADWVALDNVTLLDVTTLENGSDNNHVQSVSVNITEYETLFAQPGHVWWQAMPNWISPCDTLRIGCWSGVLSFQFAAGPAPPGLPEIVPVLPFATLTTTGPWINGTLRVAGTYARAQAVIFQEGQGTDEFWYAQAFSSREIRWQWNNQTVVAAFPLPFINSGGALGGSSDLYEWNGTPAPGTLARPAVDVDVTPWIPLLDGSTWYNLTVVDNENSWQIGLALFLWNASDLRGLTGQGSAVSATLGARAGAIQGSAFLNVTEPYAVETYNLSWSQYLNVTATSFDVATASVGVDRVDAGAISIVRTAMLRTSFDVRVDTSGAVHVAVFANWTNSTVATGNSQNSTLSERGSVLWTIDGSGGGLLSTEARAATGSSQGAYAAPTASWAASWGSFQNRSSKDGVGSSAPSASVGSRSPFVPFPGRFLTVPSSGAVVRGPVPVHLVAAPGALGGGTVTFGDGTWAVPMNDSAIVNAPSLRNGTYLLNVSTPTVEGPSLLEIPLTVTGWTPPYVPPLIAQATVSSPVGEAPWTSNFSGAAQGGTAPYSWAWSFGDGASANTENATHLYTAPGEFVADLNVTDSVGRMAQAQVDVAGFPAVHVALTSSPSTWTTGAAAVVTANVTGGEGPFEYSWGQLPTGCSPTGPASVRCTPAVPGNLSLAVTVTDALGYSDQATYNASVGPAPAAAAAPSMSLVEVAAIGAIVLAVAAGGAWALLRARSRGR